MSCNGCRVLRKGCSDDCALRPCLDWIKSPESQSNATLFLAKFYGRAGLINLVNAGTTHLRPEIFKSLMYEACGRIINPVHGSVGLMCSGEWHRCQEAVEAVLQGSPLIITTTTTNLSTLDDHVECVTPLLGCDIRHLPKESATYPNRVRTTRKRFKRSAVPTMSEVDLISEQQDSKFTITGWNSNNNDFCQEFINREPSHESLFSGETVELALVNQNEDYKPVRPIKPEPDAAHIELELTLGLNYPMVIEIVSDSEP